MATTVRQGTKLAFEDRGAGKPAFVFVHGWTCDRSFFAPQAEHFAQRHRVVSVDLRGHGESDKPQGAYPVAAMPTISPISLESLASARPSLWGIAWGARPCCSWPSRTPPA
jgi:pimeloyl-ACP methyl ester carboxylesterase